MAEIIWKLYLTFIYKYIYTSHGNNFKRRGHELEEEWTQEELQRKEERVSIAVNSLFMCDSLKQYQNNNKSPFIFFGDYDDITDWSIEHVEAQPKDWVIDVTSGCMLTLFLSHGFIVKNSD